MNKTVTFETDIKNIWGREIEEIAILNQQFAQDLNEFQDAILSLFDIRFLKAV